MLPQGGHPMCVANTGMGLSIAINLPHASVAPVQPSARAEFGTANVLVVAGGSRMWLYRSHADVTDTLNSQSRSHSQKAVDDRKD